MQYAPLSISENGGSQILGYELWRDDGNDGDFVNLFFADTILGTSFTDNNVVKAEKYRYKYRARNINGWGPFSKPAYLLAADTPSAPKAPLLILVDHS